MWKSGALFAVLLHMLYQEKSGNQGYKLEVTVAIFILKI
jgi:hypothetical protein